jgi:hypothetical protein
MLNFIAFSKFDGKNSIFSNSCIDLNTKKNIHTNCRLYIDQTFQHRARLSLLKSFSCNFEKRFKIHDHQRNVDKSVSQLTRKRISLSKKGKKKKKKVVLKIKNSLKGRKFSSIHKKNIRHSLMGIKNPMFGRIHSKITKRRIGKKLLKKKI